MIMIKVLFICHGNV